jgi:hypothetical protein
MGVARELVGDAGRRRAIQRGASVISETNAEDGVLPDEVPPSDARHCPLASDEVAIGFFEPCAPARTGQGQNGQQGQTEDEEPAPPGPGQTDASHRDQEGRSEQRRPRVGEHDADQAGDAESCCQKTPTPGDRTHRSGKCRSERGHRGMGQSQSVKEEPPGCKALLAPKRLANAVHRKVQEGGHGECPAHLVLDRGQQQGEDPAHQEGGFHWGPSNHCAAEERGPRQGGGVETMEPQSRRRKARHPVQPGHQGGDGLPARQSKGEKHGTTGIGS